MSLMKTLPFAALLALTGAAHAQSTETTEPAEGDAQTEAPAETAGPAEGAEETPPDALELNMGETAPDGPALGSVYVEASFNDWELRCIKSEAEVDPCQMYQLLDDGNGNPVAEINIFPLPEEQEAAAGATVITPLETLLTQQLAMSVDGSQAKRYPFSWCSEVGCFARLGFSDDDIAAFKRGSSASLVIVPVAAPDQKVSLKVSLNGFTAAYDAAVARQQQ